MTVKADKPVTSTTRARIRYGLFLAVAAIVVATATHYLFGDNKLRFKEEVQLSNGEVIEIDRTFKTQSLGEVGGPGGWDARFNSFVISRPVRADNPPAWQSDAGLIPMIFDRDQQSGEWFLVTTFYTCEAWYRLGKPKLPYAEFRLRNGRWEKVPLSPQLIGHEANVLTMISNKKELSQHTLATKRERMSDVRIDPSYNKIVARWITSC